MVTVPGALRMQRPHSDFFNAQDSLSSNVNGQSRLANNVQIEGIDDNHRTGLLTTLIPSAEAIETVNISTSAYDAEFGRAGGAITNVTLKSGTNTLKGSVFAFGNNEKTNAPGYFTHTAPPGDYLQSGFTLGGPIQHEQAVLLRRLPAHPRQRRPDDARGDSAGRLPDRRLQRFADEDLRSADRQRRRHRPHAVSEQHHSDRSHQPDRARDSRERAGAERRCRARSTQLPDRLRAREDDRLVRHQVQLAAQSARPGVGALQFPASEAGRIRRSSAPSAARSRAVRPATASRASAPTPPTAPASTTRARSAARWSWKRAAG